MSADTGGANAAGISAAPPQPCPTLKPTGSDPTPTGVRIARATAIVLAGWLVLAGLVAAARVPMNHDVAWIFWISARLLDGAVLYRDIIEINPPLIVWLTVPGAALARLTGWPANVSLVLAIVLWTACSLSLSLRVSSGDRAAIVVGTVGLAFILPNYNFGQRDHLIALSLIPLVCLARARARGQLVPTRIAVFIGVFAAVGIAIKPFYVTVWLALASRDGRAALGRPEFRAIIATAILYGAAIWAFAPDFLGVVSQYARAYRSFGTRSFGAIVTAPSIVFAAIVAPLVWLFARDREFGRLAVVGSAGALVAVLIQGKGWDYHHLPLWGFLLLGLLLTLDASWSGIVAAAGVAYMALVPSLRVIAEAGTGENRQSNYIAGLRSAVGAPRSLVMLSSEMEDAFPFVVETGIRLIASYPVLWAFHPPANAAADTDALRRVRQQMGQRVLADIAREQPAVILAETPASFATRFRHDFDVIGYLRTQPGGSALAPYVLADTVSRFTVWHRAR